MRAVKKKKKFAGIGIKGMFRVNIRGDGELVGDSGWKGNIVTNDGISYILDRLSKDTPTFPAAMKVELGTGGAVAYGDSALPGAIDPAGGTVTIVKAVTTAASGAYHTLRYTVTFASGWNGATAQSINNVGLYDTDGSASAGNFFAGNTFASSLCATNQVVEVTYDIKMGGQV